jgi:putative ABC transport system permease protein
VGRFIVSELWHRRGRTAALIAAIVLATASFTVLTGTSRSQRLEVRGTVSQSFRSAYDILVRPRGARTDLERRSGLVRPNYLSGEFGGITLRQWRRIRRIPGVDVAAPIANIGYVLPTLILPLDLTGVDPGHGRVVLRVRPTWVTDRGLTRIGDRSAYAYITDNPIRPPRGGLGATSVEQAYELATPHERLASGRWAGVCTEEAVAFAADGPFDRRYRTTVECFSRRTGFAGWGGRQFRRGHVGAQLRWPVPFLLAAIDPGEEARLTGLDRTVVRGRYLRPGDGVRDVPAYDDVQARHLAVPVVAASRSLVDEALELTVERFTGRAADGVVRQPMPTTYEQPLHRYLDRLAGGEVVERLRVSPESAYAKLLSDLRQPLRQGVGPQVRSYWTLGPTSYRTGGGELVPKVVPHASAGVWEGLATIGAEQSRVPSAVRDAQFRTLTSHDGHWQRGDGVGRPFPLPNLFSVGEFDPRRLRSFDPRSALPLETYAPPTLAPADDRAARLLHGRPLAPNGNLAGYLSQPPLLLTTFRAARAFAPRTYERSSAAAPISAVRVRVAGVTGPDAISRERIRVAAERVARATGLDVDITIGSSPSPKRVLLPGGRFGRPPLLLEEPWVKKNVAARILAAIDRKSVVLFGLILVVCALFVANATAAAVRARRTQFGLLAALGWPGSRLFAVVIGELAVLGLSAGALGGLLALPIAAIAGVEASVERAALAIAAAVLLAVLAGCAPAIRAARSSPVAAMRPPVVQARRSWHPRGIVQLALLSMLRVPGRAALGAASLAIGTCALTLLLAVSLTFSDTLVGTLLGDAISIQIRGTDYIAVAAMLALGVVAVADVLFLGVRERAAELATLRAAGWDDRSLGRLVGVEGLWLGVAGSLVGCGAGLAGAARFSGSLSGPLLAVAAGAAIGGVALAWLATLAPVAWLKRTSLVSALAED